MTGLTSRPPARLANHLRKLIKNQTDVSLSMARHVSLKEAKAGNLVFSPLSIQMVVSTATAGANGETLRQMLNFLNSKSIGDLRLLSSKLLSTALKDSRRTGSPKFNLASSIWIQEGLSLNPNFKYVLDNDYKVDSHEVDFLKQKEQAVFRLNSWIEKRTKGLINGAVRPDMITPLTRLMFVNTVYFKGTWEEVFDKSDTRKEIFQLVDGKSVKVPFMTSSRMQMISVFDGFRVLSLPYKQGQEWERKFSMNILLPDSKDGLPALVERVCSEPNFLDRHLPTEPVKVGEFKIPRFKVSFAFEACDALKELGLSLPSSAGGLTGILDSDEGRELQMERIIQNSVIEVDEEGTEAAAATMRCCRFSARCTPPTRVDFVADHPFLFLIREDISGAVIFFGHVFDPCVRDVIFS